MEKLLEVRDLRVHFRTHGGEVQAVRGVSFDLYKGETLCIVGESGCGKSVTAQTIMRLIPVPPGRIVSGSIRFQGKDLVRLPEREMQRIRGRSMGMIFQDPMTSLNPTMTIGRQIAEPLIKHQGMRPDQARARAIELLRMVGIPNPEERVRQYPHQFSGGMRQRAMIAIALACNPALLIADEPTTALDVTIQAQILELMQDLKRRLGTAIILITHDLGVVARMADRIAVMYAGQIVEQGTAEEIFHHPKHPYTEALLRSIPRLDDRRERLQAIPGTPPDLFSPPAGCAFAARCPYTMRVCHTYDPQLEEIRPGHLAKCWLHHPYAPVVGLNAEERGA
ncbi:ABC transporter ATP-binding protein [Thermaerobacter composti]|uniref:ABC transporter ATP-binding protein n=1 Tax=Thermaerobacter composti TaxID=554949 RepID=A0ABZ0QPB7_9FIRM|nr:ABC transporter ATP-binding protein [Thermaerobacter composti]WPD19336.1 ABC transporter ATP-binding protein [Thermaerobacter composti]